VTDSQRGPAPQQRSRAAKIRHRLDEAEATLDAIRTGRVDAVVVTGPRGEKTLTIEGAAHPSFVLLDAMSDGAALLTPSGEILFANRGLGVMSGVSADTLRGMALGQVVIPADRAAVGGFLATGALQTASREFSLRHGNESATPVAVTVSPVSLDAAETAPSDARNGNAVLMAVFTDLTYKHAVEAARARLLERLISAEDDERRRIARELHDEAGQSLTAILVGLRAVADMALSASARSAVLRLRDVTGHTVDDIGRLARGLHPAVLDDKGLAAAARRYVADFARASDLTVDATVGRRLDSPRLAPLAAATMYRILQECLTNVTRHARATHARVELRRDDHTIELVVQDDGRGFKVRRGSDVGLGLRGMRERVALSGGTIDVVSTPGHGTTVRVQIPAGRAVRRARRAARP
jgi:signal transduction histidine kinase